jgi:DNA-binding response OmpR family regulator
VRENTEMPYKIVILKSKTGALQQAERFLTNRDWQVTSCVDLRDCLGAVLKLEPDFVLLAADHPSGKARGLPKVIAQAVSTQFICYVESTSGAAIKQLNEFK